MFVDGSDGLADLGLDPADVPDTLRRFCFYQWVGQGSASPVEDPPLPLEAVSLDCPAVEPAGNAFSEDLQDAHHALFRARVEAPDDHASLMGSSVMVAMVDGATTLSTAAQLEHPAALTALIEDVACPPTGCGIEVLPTLALPLDASGALVVPGGGSYGTRGHVALGIIEAVARWRERMSQGGADARLVINLSLGWACDGAPA